MKNDMIQKLTAAVKEKAQRATSELMTLTGEIAEAMTAAEKDAERMVADAVAGMRVGVAMRLHDFEERLQRATAEATDAILADLQHRIDTLAGATYDREMVDLAQQHMDNWTKEDAAAFGENERQADYDDPVSVAERMAERLMDNEPAVTAADLADTQDEFPAERVAGLLASEMSEPIIDTAEANDGTLTGVGGWRPNATWQESFSNAEKEDKEAAMWDRIEFHQRVAAVAQVVEAPAAGYLPDDDEDEPDGDDETAVALPIVTQTIGLREKRGQGRGVRYVEPDCYEPGRTYWQRTDGGKTRWVAVVYQPAAA